MPVDIEISRRVSAEATDPRFVQNLVSRLMVEDQAVAGFMLAYKETHGGEWGCIEPAAVVYRLLELANEKQAKTV